MMKSDMIEFGLIKSFPRNRYHPTERYQLYTGSLPNRRGFMRLINWILILILLFTFNACSDRERLNPLDPKNPITHGKPVGLSAIPDRDSVRLSWSPIDVDDFVGYHVFKGYDSTQLELFTRVGADCTGIIDTGLTYDRDHYYAIQGETVYNMSLLSDVLRVVPGPFNIWIADVYAYRIQEISYDGTYILTALDFSSPRAIEYDADYGVLWVADYWEQRVYALDQNLTKDHFFLLDGYPLDLAIDRINGKLYVLLSNNRIKGYSYYGQEILSLDLEESVSVDSKLVYCPTTSSLWLTAPNRGSVTRVILNTGAVTLKTFRSLGSEGPIEVDPIEGGVWVATRSGIARITKEDSIYYYLSHLHIRDISVEPSNGDCYYTGNTVSKGEWTTGYLRYADPSHNNVILDSDYPDLYNIQVIPGTGEPGIIVQQAFSWKLLRFTSRGEQIGELSGFNSVLDFVLK
jgi:hypothetical protein